MDDNVSTYDFSFSPVPFILNGKEEFILVKIEYIFEVEDLSYFTDNWIKPKITHGKWAVTSKTGNVYTWNEGDIKMSFFKDKSGDLTGAFERVTASSSVMPVVTLEKPKANPLDDYSKWMLAGPLELYGVTTLGRRPEVSKLPGIREMVVHPVTGKKHMLEDIVIDLNDRQGWTRFQVADWLETLDIDIRFKTEEPKQLTFKEKHVY